MSKASASSAPRPSSTATGDAALSDLCGAECKVILRDIDAVAPSTLCSLFAGMNWDDPAYGERLARHRQGQGPRQEAAADRRIEDGHFSQADRFMPGMNKIGKRAGAAQRRAHLQSQRAEQPQSLSDGMMFGRKLAVEYLEFFRKYVPGCEEIELLTTAPVMGVRDTRRIVGEFELTIEDFQSARQFPDQIAVYNRPTDVHPTDTSEKEYERFLRRLRRLPRPGRGRLPRRALQHPGAEGLEQSLGRRPLPFERHQGARLDPRAVRRLHDGSGVGHRGRAVDPHRPAGLRSRYLGAGGDAARSRAPICRRKRSRAA